MLKKKYIPALLAVVIGCGTPEKTGGINGETDTDMREEKSIKFTANSTAADYSTFTNDVNGYAMRLFDLVCRNEKKDNIFISPASAYWALAMTANGADGETLSQIISVLGLEGNNIEELNRQQQAIISESKEEGDTCLSIANSIWINQHLRVKPHFIKTNQEYYDAEVRNIPFNDAATDSINKWCTQKTNGKITSIIETLNESNMMLLLNAMHFKDEWSKPFMAGGTEEAPFIKEDGETMKVQMMNQKFNTSYYENDSIQIVTKPFANNRYEMVFILPRKGITLEQATAILGKNFTSWHNKMATGTSVIFGLPKFKTEYNTSLKKTLQAMGIENAFNNKADFSGISDAPLYVDDVFQKSYIKIDEKGAEAAAVTATMIGLMSARPILVESKKVILDRPFIYMITDNSTTAGNILFIGKAGAPTE